MATCNNQDTDKYLHIYYQHLFPFKEICTWLCYGDVTTFSRREFAIRLCDQLILRNQVFSVPSQFMVRIFGELPRGIDIGAIYDTLLNASLSKSVAEKELVFDIDISDYDNVRSCCKGRSICIKCWKYIVIACKILNLILKFDFGCSHILWVFSGRRGIHCWVCDKGIRILGQAGRRGIISYLVKGNRTYWNKNKLLPGKKLDYNDRRFLKIIEPEFVAICIIDQKLLDTKEGVDDFLSLLPNDEARSDVQKLFKNHQSTIDRWSAFIAYYNDMIHSQAHYWQGWEEFLALVKLHYCFPRFDSSVTEDIKHLLKCPFSVHPETGRIAIPFDLDEVESFDPSASPTLEQLINEIVVLNKERSSEKEEGDMSIYQKTSLKKPVDILKQFVEKIVL